MSEEGMPPEKGVFFLTELLVSVMETLIPFLLDLLSTDCWEREFGRSS
jgi:hypothetical protein